MVTKNTRKNREQLSLRSTDFAQAHPFGTLVSDQDTSSNNVLTSHPVSRRMVLKTGLGAAVAATGIGTWLGLHANATHAFFLGNAAIQWDNAVLQAIRNIGVGPTVASRAIAITHTSMYDAWATYDAVAVPTRPNGIPRQAGKYSDATMAVSYAAYRALLDLFPSQASLFTTQMNAMGFDPNNTSTDTTTQVGVGNVAAQAVIAYRHTDGSNQAGNYADTSGYVPVNTPDQIIDPTRWQPLRVPNGNGGFVVQKYLTPHWGTVTPFALTSGSQFRPSGPVRDATSSAYKSQADQILQYSANLNDQTKTIADYWANGPHTETPPGHWDVFAQFYIAQFLSLKYKHDLNHDVKMFFALSNALFDAGIACWECKRAYDYVRPITAVHYLYPYPNKVTAWAGYGKGTQSIYGRDWMPFQEPTIVTPPFPEYVSGHSTFSAAGAYILRQVTGFDLFIDSYLAEPGSSHIEPGITPMLAVVLYWPTLSSAADEAGLSRRYGGIHFQQGDLGGRTLGQQVAANGWSKAQSYFNGTVTGNDNDD
jgi:membrane-associated phospholipid phosphatase